ncbi:NADP-dependent oxidoreductase [Microbacterium saccharophilum]|uniref:NADP-dependent oxidoreductase n=1 Tax=Microbacterium saccharophilum TaxID=1213358 RepID=A0A5C8HV70_9MICO|nr:NADP-dependent oxidoreductase [Microbacterium saccharophilum]TXK09158.1 NADP-dependent oxidoreductase [Microbacterium saccharophilum]GEP47667.1 putative oxidoreductase [Microbacterium saccharophilum]
MAVQWMATTWGAPDAWELREVEVPAPRTGEVTIRVHAAGVNPADAKHVAVPRDGVDLPLPIGYEVSGVLTAVGPDTRIASGAAGVGDEVIAFRVQGGYATELTVPADLVLRKPTTLTHPAAANLLLAGTTAAEMLAVTGVQAGETILLHAASGAVGVAVLQLAAARGVRVIGTASEAGAARVTRYGGVPVRYGPGLADRVRDLAPDGIAAALDAVGTAEALDVSLELVTDRQRILTIADGARAQRDGIRFIAGALPESARFRAQVRGELVDLAEQGLLEVPVARTYTLAEAPEALRFLMEGHPGGKLALIP